MRNAADGGATDLRPAQLPVARHRNQKAGIQNQFGGMSHRHMTSASALTGAEVDTILDPGG
jgi:hypothetical protein